MIENCENMMHSGEAYFLYHSIGLYPRKAADLAAAMAQFAELWGADDDGQWGGLIPLRQQFIDLWSALIGAPEGTLTTAENVTAALHALVTSLPARHLKGKRLLIAGDCFPSLHFLLTGLAPRLGFTLDTVQIRQGESWVLDEDMISRWGDDVGLALITWVSSTTSHRCDLQALVDHGRRMGSIVGVDITQAAGLLPFDVKNPAVDFAISTSLKWMCGTPGAGILQVAAPLIAKCQPELRGWFSQDNPFSWDLNKFAFAPDARRFDSGTPGIVAAIATIPALEWHAGQDQKAILAHNRVLSRWIIEGLDTLRLPLISPRNEDERGGSVMLRLPDRVAPTVILERFRASRVFADARGTVLRLSPGIMTTIQGVEKMLSVLGEAVD